MQLGKLILSYLFLCLACLPTALGSTNKCRHSPNTDCYQENLLTGWFHDLSSSRVQCFMMNTCSNSSYFSSKEECEQKCALKCQEPTSNSPYEPNTVIISKDIQGHGGLTYSSYSTCGSGYILIGSSERTCNANGNWSGEEPICYEIIVAITSGGDTYELDSSNILEVEKGQQLKITCTVKESVIDHDIAWRKVKGQRTHALPSLHDMRTGKDILNSLIYIQIDRASSVHSGIYSCLSQNNPILLSRNFTLRVKDPKKAPNMISSSIIIAKNTITLRCYGYGQPIPRVNWYKDGIDGVLVHGENITLSGPNDAIIVITISNPNCTHIGKYICKAENEHGMLVDSEKTVTAEDVGLPDIGSGAYECRETHNESCFLCPYNKAPSVKTCNMSDTVISVRLSVNETSLNSSKMYMINESKVLKGSNSSNLQLNTLKLTEKAATCHCPTLNAETWFICTGTIHKDMFIVSEKDIICATSDHHQKNVEKHCRELDSMKS